MDDDVQKIVSYYKDKNYSGFSIYLKYLSIFYKKLKFYIRSFNKTISPEIREKIYDDAWQNDINDFKFWFNKEKRTQLFSYENNMFIACGGLTQRIWQYYIFKILKEINPKKVLEVGSGNGINLCLLSSYFETIDFKGIDISSIGIEKANKLKINSLNDNFFAGWPIKPLNYKVGNASFEKANALKINFKDNEFDFVFSILALEQMDDIKYKVINEMIRVSSKYICFVEPFIEYNKSLLKIFHHRGSKYFSYKIKDLEKHNLKILQVFDDHPNKVTLGVAAILCEKKS